MLAVRLRGRSRPIEHRRAEEVAILGLADHVGVRGQHRDAEPLEDAALVEFESHVETGLAAHGGQEGVGALAFDDAFNHFRGDGLDVGPVGHLRIGHDGRGVAVDEDDFVALFAERLARLRAGVVELSGLPDDDRAGSEDEDAVNVVPARHQVSRAARKIPRGGVDPKGGTGVVEVAEALGRAAYRDATMGA